jgi:hypothetical protein
MRHSATPASIRASAIFVLNEQWLLLPKSAHPVSAVSTLGYIQPRGAVIRPQRSL